MSTVPIIASVGDLAWAVRRAERYAESRAYVAQRAVELGHAHVIPGSWGPAVLASVTAEKRHRAANAGNALPDESFPIENLNDLDNAISSIGRAKDYDKAKRFIIKRARELNAVGKLPEDWGVTASLVAAGWDESLHPRDRHGKFIDFHGLLNLFDGSDFSKPSMRAEATGVRKEGGHDILTVRAKSAGNYDGKAHAVGDEFDVPSDRVESAPDAKASLGGEKKTFPVFKGQVKPGGEVIKGEPTDLKKGQDRADAAAKELADAEASGDKARITKARIANTAAKKNLEKQQGLDNQAGADLTSQLEQSVANLPQPGAPDAGAPDSIPSTGIDNMPEPSAPDLPPLTPEEMADDQVHADVYNELDARGIDYSSAEDGVNDYIQNEIDAGNRDPQSIADGVESDFNFGEETNDNGDTYSDFSDRVAAALSDDGISLDQAFPDPVELEDAWNNNEDPVSLAMSKIDEFSGGAPTPADNHGVSDNLDVTTPLTPAEQAFEAPPAPDTGLTPAGPANDAAQKWLDDNFDYLNSIPDNARIDIENAIKDGDYGRASQIMNDNYEYGHGDAIDSFDNEVMSAVDTAAPSLTPQVPGTVDTPVYENDDPAIQDAFDQWAAAAAADGANPDWIKNMVQQHKDYPPTWKAADPASAEQAGRSSGGSGSVGGKDVLQAYPIGDPRQYGFGGYEVWAVDENGKRSGGRGNFPDKASADAFIKGSNEAFAEHSAKRGEAAAANAKQWASDKDPEVIKSALENVEDAMSEYQGKPAWEGELTVLAARRSALQEALDKAPAPNPKEDVTPTEQALSPVTPNSAQRSAIALSLGNSASNKGIDVGTAIDDIFASATPEDAHKKMAQTMTQLKLGGKQRARMRQLLDLHFGQSGDNSAKVEAIATADTLSDDNPLKAKLVEKATALTPSSTPKPGGAPSDFDLEQQFLKSDPYTPERKAVEDAWASRSRAEVANLSDADLKAAYDTKAAMAESASKAAMSAKTGTPSTNADARAKRIRAGRLAAERRGIDDEIQARKAAAPKPPQEATAFDTHYTKGADGVWRDDQGKPPLNNSLIGLLEKGGGNNTPAKPAAPLANANAGAKPAYSKASADKAASGLISDLNEMAYEDPSGPWSSYASPGGVRGLVQERADSIQEDLDSGAPYVTIKVPGGSELSVTRDDAWQMLMDAGIVPGKA